ncbi:MAG: GNAT family N-acetyltransferase, partial [Candidatus Melainabacteria bacterium HGW-Melainabacteria-1]
ILQKVEDIARRLGCCKMTLEVLEGNAVAVNLYRSLGFRNYELDPAMGRAYFLEKKLPQE